MVRVAILAVTVALLGFTSASAATFDIKYSASIYNVVQLGALELKGKIAPNAYAATATMETVGVADLFGDNKISTGSTGHVSPGGLTWTNFTLDHAYSKKRRQTKLARTAAGLSADIRPGLGGDPSLIPVTDQQKLLGRDPINALLEMSRSVGASGTCSGSYPVFDGKTFYYLQLSPKSKATFAMGGYNGPATVCALRYVPVSGMKPPTPEERARIPVTDAWFAAPVDGFAMILSIQIPTPIGLGRIDVVNYTVTP